MGVESETLHPGTAVAVAASPTPTAQTAPGWFHYLLPMGCLLALSAGMGLEGCRPWYEYLYSAHCGIVGYLCWYCRHALPQPEGELRSHWRWIGLSILVGLIGTGVWVLLVNWERQFQITSLFLPGGLLTEARVGWQPTASGHWTLGELLFLWIRLAGMVLLVPIVEELFWRGFLFRYFQSETFQEIPWGTWTWPSVLWLSLAFALVHTRTEFWAALVWSALISALYIYTKKWWACVIAHAVTNAALAGYILSYHDWQLW